MIARRRPARRRGPRIHPPSITCGSTPIIGRSRVYRHRLGNARRQTTRWSTRKRIERYFVSLGQTQSGRFAEISVHDHETSEYWLIDATGPTRRPTLVAARETAVQYECRASSRLGWRRDARHPHQRGRRRGLQDRARAARPPGPRQLARSGAAPARRRTILSVTVFADWLIRLEREDGLPRIVVRDLTTGEEHSDRVCRRSLFARLGERLRVRHRHAALHLFVDDDTGRGLGLRPGDRARTLRKRAGSPERTRSVRLCDAAAARDGA